MEPTEFFRLLRGALHSVQLYPPESPVVRRGASAFHRAVAEYAAGRVEGVSASFLDDGAYLDGRPAPVPAAAERGGPSLDLYRIGLRELRILDGVTLDEVERLLRVLARSLAGQFNPVDEDLSLQLWEEDLPHITYLLFEEPSSEPFPSEEVAIPAPDPGLEAFLADGSPFTGALPGAAGFRLGEEERMRILAGYRCQEEPETPLKFGRLLLEILRAESSEEEALRTAAALNDHLDLLEREGRVVILSALRERVEPGVAASVPAGRLLREVEARFRDPERTMALFRARNLRAEDRRAAARLAGRVPAELAYRLLTTIEDQPDGIEGSVVEVLRRRLEADRDLQVLALTGARDSLRRVVLDSFTPREEDMRHLRDLLQRAAPELRLLVVKAVARGDGCGSLAALIEILHDEAPEVRMEAAEALGRRGGHSALEPLLRLIAARDFLRRPADERRCILLAAGRASPREVWPVLARLAERRRTLFPRRRPCSGDPVMEALAALPEPVPTLLRDRWRRRHDLCAALEEARAPGSAAGAGEGEGRQATDEDRSRAA